MYTFFIVMIAIASILLILAVLVQSPKSGMAANFGAANQTIGVRQTTDILEKFTWAMIVAIVVFSLLSTTAVSKKEVKEESLASKVLNETNTQT
ncbi:MAG: preprotein translocase subunit SecG [Alistipes sp.]|nr:preprotein translocase subunit SecG [Alistipes sp.]